MGDARGCKEMCELLGISSNIEVNPTFSFKELKIRGGLKGPHDDGWGIGFYQENKPFIYKEPKPAWESELAKKIECGEITIKSKITISHIRFASAGIKSVENTHPFQKRLFGRDWIFAHNGTVRVFHLNTGSFKPLGQTDSEHAFCYMLNEIENACDNKYNYKKTLSAVRACAEKISGIGKFNFLLSDSEHLFCFGHTSLYYTERKFGNFEITLDDSNFTINVRDMKQPNEEAVIVATKRLTKNEDWKPINGLIVVMSGKIARL